MSTADTAAERLLERASDVIRRLLDHPLLWLAPALLALAVFQLYPMAEAILMSLTNESLIRPSFEFVGLEQYVRLASDPQFWEMIRITAIYAFFSVVLHVLLGLVLALAIDYGVRRGLRGHLTTRVSVLLAWIVPGIIIGLVWKVMLVESQFGAVNHFLGVLGIGPVPFRSDPTLALISTIIAGTWRGTAFTMIMIYGGLQRVPQRLYEAARVDGAGRWDRFRHVTLPQLKPVLFITTVLVTIYALNTFDLIFALTGGGPGRATQVLALFMYQEAFQDYALGRGAAIAVVMLVANLLLTGVYLYAFDVGDEI
ncbi:sugar ABC transporter permease [Halobacteriales archaeon QS_9_67_15]|nr:MAG: sugar ABC transporter permease [Halobacteriales archaeon QS_9_67_15]